MHEFSVSKDMEKINNDKMRMDMVVGKVAAHMSNTNYQRIQIYC